MYKLHNLIADYNNCKDVRYLKVRLKWALRLKAIDQRAYDTCIAWLNKR